MRVYIWRRCCVLYNELLQQFEYRLRAQGEGKSVFLFYLHVGLFILTMLGRIGRYSHYVYDKRQLSNIYVMNFATRAAAVVVCL